MAACCTVAAYLVMRVLALHGSVIPRTSLLRHAGPAKPLGFQHQNSVLTLKISGITCAACVESIERGLESLPGVLMATVSMVTYEAVVKHTYAVTVADVLAEVETLGFGADVVEMDGSGNNIEDADHARAVSIETWKAALIGATTCTVATILIGSFPASLDVYWGPESRLVVQAALCILAVLFFGSQIHHEAAIAVRHGRIDMSLLTSLGTVLALLKSIYLVTFLPLEELSRQTPLLTSTAMLTAVIIGGRFLKAVAMRHSMASVLDLSLQMPESVSRMDLRDGNSCSIVIPLRSVKKGDCLVVYPGDIIPTDGIVKSGSGYVSETHINGEILPVSKSSGQVVIAGSANQDAQLLVEVTRVGRVTWFQQALQLIADGNARKSGTQELTDRIATYFIKVILTIAFAAGILHYLRGATSSEAVDRLIAVLLCACPCAIGLASPTAVTIGIGIASKSNVMLYGGSACIESAATVKTILFDKTGTLTTGSLAVVEVLMSSEWQKTPAQKRLLWKLIQLAEDTSKHPVARAIVLKAHEELSLLELPFPRDTGEQALEVKESTSTQGLGLLCKLGVQGSPPGAKNTITVAIGSSNFVAPIARISPLEFKLHHSPGKTNRVNTIESFVLIDGVFAASLIVQDQIRPEAKHAVEELKYHGYQVGMLTGGTFESATFVAEEVGIHRDWVWAGLLPEDKVKKIHELKQNYGGTAMIGDNLNDVQAMAAADFSMGTFIDVNSITAVSVDAMIIDDSSAVSSVHGLLKVPYLFELARNVYGTIKMNLMWAMAYNAIAVLLSSGILQGFGLLLNPINAGIGMSLSSVLVLVHTMRLERWKPRYLENISTKYRKRDADSEDTFRIM